MRITKGYTLKIPTLELLESLLFYTIGDSSIFQIINHLSVYSYKYFTLI
jgi:hypothetical protein